MPRSRIAVATLILVIGGLTARLLWIAGHLETGADTLRVMLSDGVLEWIGKKPVPLPNRKPSEQSDFWLAESDRILGKTPTDVDLVLGAAWVLDSPTNNNQLLFFDGNPIRGMAAGSRVSLNEVQVEQAEKEFETKCATRCLQLAERACNLDPKNVLCWRTRALLAWHMSINRHGDLRSADPLPILKECASHDTDNALYDYLVALSVRGHADQLDNLDTENWYALVIEDEAQFANVVDYFERGQRKPLLAVGEQVLPAVSRFLAASRLSHDSQLEVALSRLITLRGSLLFMDLCRLQQARADQRLKAGDPATAIEMHRQVLRMISQAEASGDFRDTNSPTLEVGQSTITALKNLALGHPNLATAEEEKQWENLASILERRRSQVSAIVDIKVIPRRQFESLPLLMAGIFANVAIQATVLLAVVSLVCLGFARWLSCHDMDDPAKLGIFRQGLVWLAVSAVTIAWFGVVPAGVLSTDGRRSASFILLWLTEGIVFLTAVFFLLRSLRGRRYRTNRKEAIISMAAGALLILYLPVFNYFLLPLQDRQLDFLPQIRELKTPGYVSILSSLNTNWPWAFVQWYLWGGITITAVSVFLLLALWYSSRSARQQKRSFLKPWQLLSRRFTSGILRTVGRSAAVVASCCMVAWLGLAPTLLRAMEDKYQSCINYVRNPATYYTDLERQADAQLLMKDQQGSPN